MSRLYPDPVEQRVEQMLVDVAAEPRDQRGDARRNEGFLEEALLMRGRVRVRGGAGRGVG